MLTQRKHIKCSLCSKYLKCYLNNCEACSQNHVDSVADRSFTGIPGCVSGQREAGMASHSHGAPFGTTSRAESFPLALMAWSQHQAILGDFLASSWTGGWAGQTWQGLVRFLPTFNKGILYTHSCLIRHLFSLLCST